MSSLGLGTRGYYDTGSSGGGGSGPPPVIDITYPTKAIDPVIVEITDADSLSIAVYIQLDQGFSFVAFDDDYTGNPNALGFMPFFDRGSTDSGGNPRTLRIYRYGGWPTGAIVNVTVKVIDATGNEEIA